MQIRECGDAILSGLVKPKYVERYSWKDETRFGSELRDVEMILSGEKGRKIVYRKGERVRIRPNVKAPFMIIEDYKEGF